MHYLFSEGKAGYKKYRGMFQFDARNADELSLNVGDIVLVSLVSYHFNKTKRKGKYFVVSLSQSPIKLATSFKAIPQGFIC